MYTGVWFFLVSCFMNPVILAHVIDALENIHVLQHQYNNIGLYNSRLSFLVFVQAKKTFDIGGHGFVFHAQYRAFVELFQFRSLFFTFIRLLYS